MWDAISSIGYHKLKVAYPQIRSLSLRGVSKTEETSSSAALALLTRFQARVPSQSARRMTGSSHRR